ncbi:hypothetical protein SESBI_40424 [Sesbania bispinosa]|nr:hypothetical protein SESBI_40424 [Sesbania bispinosa]
MASTTSAAVSMLLAGGQGSTSRNQGGEEILGSGLSLKLGEHPQVSFFQSLEPEWERMP